MKKVLVFAGSTRKHSVNKKLAAVAAEMVRAAGSDVTLIDLADYPAPVYDGDLEAGEGIPQTMRDLKALIASHDAMLIVTPEYNGFVPPVLVNSLDWASRSEGQEKSTSVFAGKKAAIAAASPGGLGGVRVIPRLRDFLAELGVMTVPGFATLPGAHQAFDENGELANAATLSRLEGLVSRLLASIG